VHPPGLEEAAYPPGYPGEDRQDRAACGHPGDGVLRLQRHGADRGQLLWLGGYRGEFRRRQYRQLRLRGHECLLSGGLDLHRAECRRAPIPPDPRHTLAVPDAGDGGRYRSRRSRLPLSRSAGGALFHRSGGRGGGLPAHGLYRTALLFVRAHGSDGGDAAGPRVVRDSDGRLRRRGVRRADPVDSDGVPGVRHAGDALYLLSPKLGDDGCHPGDLFFLPIPAARADKRGGAHGGKGVGRYPPGSPITRKPPSDGRGSPVGAEGEMRESLSSMRPFVRRYAHMGRRAG